MEIGEGNPWIRKDGTFLMYDYAHVFKCKRNNWITEKCGEVKYNVDGVIQIARWNDLEAATRGVL